LIFPSTRLNINDYQAFVKRLLENPVMLTASHVPDGAFMSGRPGAFSLTADNIGYIKRVMGIAIENAPEP